MEKEGQKAKGPSGTNRTGIMAQPELSKALIEGIDKYSPRSPGDGDGIARARREVIEQAAALEYGPPPVVKGGQKTGDKSFFQLLDKMGARLAFERQGTRLYQALMIKCEAPGKTSGGPSVKDLEEICAEEKEHFNFLHDCIIDLGGDPTMETPAANVTGVASQGVVQVITDPRTNMTQSLEAILTAELTDNAAWQMLIDLAQGLRKGDLARKFEPKLKKEEDHLRKVKSWLREMSEKEIGAKAA